MKTLANLINHFLPKNKLNLSKEFLFSSSTVNDREEDFTDLSLYEFEETRELVQYVKKAVELVENKGEASFPELRTAPWHLGERYVFVASLNGIGMVNPVAPEMEGRNLLFLQDVWGIEMVKEYLTELTVSGKTSTWVHYFGINPLNNLEEWKSSFVMKASAPNGEQYAVGSGIYNLRLERALVGEDIKKACDFIQSLQQLTAELEKSTILRRRMMAGIAHELNTPLTTLRGNLEAMAEDVFSVDQARIQLLLDETIYLQRLISDLRELSLAEAGELPLYKSQVDVANSIDHVLQMLKPLLEEKDIHITTSTEIGLENIYCDKDRLHQIIYNLVLNAQKYTNQHGTISVQAKLIHIEGCRWLEIAVCDDGIGISEEDIPFIFEQFYRVDKNRSKKTGGSGIGLTIVKQLAEAHGGHVMLESRLGIGSTFLVYLPA